MMSSDTSGSLPSHIPHWDYGAPFPPEHPVPSTEALNLLLKSARRNYPFSPEIIGTVNPYSGDVIRDQSDYETFLREFCYYVECSFSLRAAKVELSQTTSALSYCFRKFKESESRCGELSQSNNLLKSENLEYRKKTNALSKYLDILDHQISSQKKEIKFLTEDADSSRSTSERLIEKNSILEKENATFKEKIDRISHLSDKNRELVSENKSLQKKAQLSNNQRQELLSSVSSLKCERNVFIALFCIVCAVCVMLSLILFSTFPQSILPDENVYSATSTSSVTPTKAAASAPYIGNSQTKIIHDNSCPHLPYSKYRVEYRTLASAFLAGYSCCPTCLGGDGESTRSTSAPSSVKQTEPEEHRYIGNKSSKKVHDPDCSFLPDKRNRVYFDDLDEALDDGYEPCKKCHPS